MNRIAVLITVHNRKEKTLKCLDDVFKQKKSVAFSLDVFLTDDGCTDGTPEAVRERHPSVNIIRGDGSLFWNRGMYRAWEEAEKGNYDYYLWLNDDTFIENDCVETLLVTSQDNNDKAIIVGPTADTNHKKITYGGRQGSKLITDLSSNYKCDHFNGNIVLIPRSVFMLLGKNDPYFRHALGDFDYGFRAFKNGIPIILTPKICGVCDEHESLPNWANPEIPIVKRFKALYSVGGNGANPFEFFYFRRKHSGFIPALITFVSNHIHTLIPKLWR